DCSTGGDIALDEISFKNSCDAVTTIGGFEPDLQQDFSLCQTGGGAILDFGGSSNSFQQVRWYEKDGVGNYNELSSFNDQKTLTVGLTSTPGPGKYRVCTQEAGKCARYDSVIVSDQLNALNINDVELCANPSETVDCGVDFVSPPINSITWKKGATPVASNVRTFDVSSPGSYTVEIVGDGNCDANASFNVTSLNANPDEDPFKVCQGQSVDLTLDLPTGTAANDIGWFENASGGTAIASGDSYLYTPGVLPKTFYIENTSSDSYTLGPANLNKSTGGFATSNKFTFTVVKELFMESFVIKADFAGATVNWTLSGGGVNVSGTKVIAATATGKINVNTLLSPGNYTFKTGGMNMAWNTSRGVADNDLLILDKMSWGGGGPGSGFMASNIKLSVPKGCARTAVNVTEKDPATCCPTFDGVSINESSLSTCASGGSETLTGSLVGSINLVTAYDFRWMNGTSEVQGWTNGAAGLTLSNASIVSGGSGSYTVEIRLAASTGCVDVSSGVSVTVNASPTDPTLTIAPNQTTFCEGEAYTVTANSSVSGGGTISYNWGLSAGTGTGNVRTGETTAGTKTYIVEVSANGCTNTTTAAKSVTVNPIPTKPTITGPAQVCEGVAYEVVGASTVAGGGVMTYDWGSSPGTAGSTDDKRNGATTAANHVYTLKVSSGGCESVAADPLTVTVNALPTVSIASGGNFCSGAQGEVTLTFTGTPDFDIEYTNSGIGGSTIPRGPYSSLSEKIDISIPGTIEVTKLTDGNGCEGTSLGSSVSLDTFRKVQATTPVLSCNPSNDYIITFDITAGDLASIDVVGAAGTLSGSTWTSNPISELVETNLLIEDINQCNTVAFNNLKRSCSCAETATLSLTDSKLCEFGSNTTT
ncbi:MAG: hypothetical protein GY893_04670, partial [bacterium]|nr:hypothetical protein [bacterium]